MIVTSPHKIYGPESNDLALQLRKHGFDSVLVQPLCPLIMNHLRDLIESGFRVVVKDATAAAILPGWVEAVFSEFSNDCKPCFTTEEIVTDIKNSKNNKNGKEIVKKPTLRIPILNYKR
jgi:nicotinamidase-related amidase